jgi:hypothetical protein
MWWWLGGRLSAWCALTILADFTRRWKTGFRSTITSQRNLLAQKIPEQIMACKAVRALRAALKPPSSGRKLAALTGVSQPTLNQLANEVHPASEATKKRLKRTIGIPVEDWS